MNILSFAEEAPWIVPEGIGIAETQNIHNSSPVVDAFFIIYHNSACMAIGKAAYVMTEQNQQTGDILLQRK